jgi:trans-L-3-hydroxyproline dehydratase
MTDDFDRYDDIAQPFHKIRVLDMHTGGEPLRLVLKGYPTLDGKSILEKRRELESRYDHLRRAIMLEPRGHADMYGALPVEAENQDSAFGVLFMHNSGYSTMCGHGTLAVARAAWEMGWIPKENGEVSFKLDVPCGQIQVKIQSRESQIQGISFYNVPSFYCGSHTVYLEGYGQISYDLAYGGAFYAYVDVEHFHLTIEPQNTEKFISLGRDIKQKIIDSGVPVEHPYEDDLGFLYGVIFTGSALHHEHHSRNVCVFANGEVDRSPTGSGVSGRVAILHKKGQLKIGEEITIESIVGSTMKVSVHDTCPYGSFQAVIPHVHGMSYFIGLNECWIDPDDELGRGFLLR